MKITKEVYNKPADQLTEEEKDFLLGAWSMKDLDKFAELCSDPRNIYAKIESVSSSGLSRKISFYCIDCSSDGKPFVKKLNRFIRCFTKGSGETKEDFLHSMNLEQAKFFKIADKRQKPYYEIDEPIKTSVCGMDVIFAELHPIFLKLKRLGYENIADDASFYNRL